jgi:hypothetical protein
MAAMRVEYVSDPYQINNASTQYLHRIVSGVYPDKYLHWNAKGSDGFDWLDDPQQQRLIIHDDVVHNEFVLERCYTTDRRQATGDGLPGTAPNEMLFAALGWWPFEKWSSPRLAGDAPAALIDIASSEHYFVRPADEPGRPRAVVLQYAGHDTLVLDLDQRTLVRRELYDPVSGEKAQTLELSNHQKFGNDIWLPTEIRNRRFARSVAGTVECVLDVKSHIKSVALGTAVPLNELIFSPLPGSIEVMPDGQFHQTVGGGQDYLDHVSRWIDKHVHSQPATTPTHLWPHYLAWALAAAIAGSAYMYRRATVAQGKPADTLSPIKPKSQKIDG